MDRFLALLGIVTLAALAISGASAATTPTRSLSHTQPPASAFRSSGWFVMNANAKHTWMYAVGVDTNEVSVYDLSRFGTPKIGSITQGVNTAAGVTLDARGNLYVANRGSSGNVTVYPPGATTPSLTLQGLSMPISIAVDPNGDVYVANRGSAPSIVVYAQGQITPYRTITDPLIQIPTQLQFDAARNLYFSDNNTAVSKIAHGSQTAVSLGLQGLSYPSGLALDPRNGNIFVSDIRTSQNQVVVYKPGSVNPVRRLSQSSADLLTVARIHNTEYLFCPDTLTNAVIVYKANARKPLTTISTDVRYLIGVAIKPAGVP
jgi:DNA-binding beta-propeller fold protein YncE